MTLNPEKSFFCDASSVTLCGAWLSGFYYTVTLVTLKYNITHACVCACARKRFSLLSVTSVTCARLSSVYDVPGVTLELFMNYFTVIIGGIYA